MKKTLGILVAVCAIAACKGNGDLTRRGQQYDVVQEGSASGVTSTINGPGETPAPVNTTPITGTSAAADTTTNFTLPTPEAGSPQQPGTLAGTMPTGDRINIPAPQARPRQSVPAPVYRPSPPQTQTPPPTETARDAAQPPPTTDTTATNPTTTTTNPATTTTDSSQTENRRRRSEKPPANSTQPPPDHTPPDQPPPPPPTTTDTRGNG